MQEATLNIALQSLSSMERLHIAAKILKHEIQKCDLAACLTATPEIEVLAHILYWDGDETEMDKAILKSSGAWKPRSYTGIKRVNANMEPVEKGIIETLKARYDTSLNKYHDLPIEYKPEPGVGNWYWISFIASGVCTGVAIIHAPDFPDAVIKCDKLGIKSHGEAAGFMLTAKDLEKFDVTWRNRLLSLEELKKWLPKNE